MKTRHYIAISLLAFAPASGLRAEDAANPAPAAEHSHSEHFADGYTSVSDALFKDRLDDAKSAASALAGQEKDPEIVKHLKGIADSTSLDEARTHFKELNEVAVPMATKDHSMKEMHCPMAFGSKGASWLQKSSDEVRNPYMGSKMPHCGKAR